MIENPFHPGVFLQELLDEYEITPYRLAKDTFMPATRVHAILGGKRALTPDTAMRLARYFGTTERYWMNLQQSYDLGQCHPEHLDEIKPLVATSSPAAPATN